MEAPEERLRRFVNAHAEALRSVRSIDTDFCEDDDEATFHAKLALDALDMGLTLPRLWGGLILFYTPEVADSQGVAAKLDALDSLDAIDRAEQIVGTVRREGTEVASSEAVSLWEELRAWAEIALAIPEVQGALIAYRAGPQVFNGLGKSIEGA